jgi:membrane protease YdiL (CAAX protease family)
MTAATTSFESSPAKASRWILFAELLIFFTILPLLLYKRLIPNWPIPILVAVTIGAFLVLRRFPNFSFSQLFQWSGARSEALAILARDAFLMLALGVAVWQFAPHLLFSLVRRAPILWAALMVLYPLCSVLPQEFLFRAYFFRRYRELFGGGSAMIAASALAFGFVHIIFGNWLAVVLSAIGGILFSTTYLRTASLSLVWLEHALFGNFLFTIGLGQFFYHAHRF